MHPKIVRTLIYPLHERLLNRPTLRFLGEIERSQWASREQIESLQLQKLKRLLTVALDHCPWHAAHIRDAGLDPWGDQELTLADLRKLPLMDKADATGHRDRLVWKEVPGGIFQYNTGGSSGQPLIFYYGRQRQAADIASRIRARRWWDVDIGDREVLLWGAPVELNKTDRIKTLRDRLFNQLLLNAFEMTAENMDRYLRAMERFNPRCIYGYASSLALLAAHAKSQRIFPHLDELQVVCTTGEPLYPSQRELIREVFGAPVSNEYGCRDGGLIALESPDGQLLVNSESLLVEVLDNQGAPVNEGEIGEVVLTNLCSDAQPFIRYRTGDMVRMSGEACRNGRGLHVIEEVMGRRTDFIVRADGAIMHALAVIYILRATPGIDQFKIVQHSVEQVEVLVQPNDAWTDSAKDRVIGGLKSRLGEGVNIDVSLKTSIPPEASGKFRYVVSHVPLPEKLDSLLL